MEQVYEALTALRAPLQQGEYDLHRLVMDALDKAAIPWAHEVKLAPRCRIDLMCGGVGVEIKRGKPEPARIRQQLAAIIPIGYPAEGVEVAAPPRKDASVLLSFVE